MRRRETAAGYFQSRRSLMIADKGEDPMAAMGNLFDVAILIGVGFLIVALSGFGVKELLTKEVTIVKNPGQESMEVIVKKEKVVSGGRGISGVGHSSGSSGGGAGRFAPEGLGSTAALTVLYGLGVALSGTAGSSSALVRLKALLGSLAAHG